MAANPRGPMPSSPNPTSRCVVEADDLSSGLFADLENKAIYHLPVGRLGGLDKAIAARAPGKMGHRRMLLQAYVATGEKKYLDAWTRYSDEWAMLYPDYADRHGGRDYFPLQTMGSLVSYLKDIQEASAQRPGLVDDLSAATLARVLMTCLEEYGPSYWRLARNTIFNHQYNILGSAYHCAQVLNDFRVGQRLDQEMQNQFHLLMTAGLTRDGSMIEVCDEGHVPGALKGPGYLYLFIKDDPPEWFDEFAEDYFLNQFYTGSRYLIRHTAPFGRQHRGGMRGHSFSSFWREWMDIPQREAWRRVGFYNGVGIETLTGDVFNEPDARAIADTVFGRGQAARPRDRHDEDAFALVTDYYTGGYQGPPENGLRLHALCRHPLPASRLETRRRLRRNALPAAGRQRQRLLHRPTRSGLVGLPRLGHALPVLRLRGRTDPGTPRCESTARASTSNRRTRDSNRAARRSDWSRPRKNRCPTAG